MTFHNYLSTVLLERRPELMAVKEVVATEKLHGTNFRVYFPHAMSSLDDVRFGGRNDVLAPDDAKFYGGRPMRWFAQRPEMLERLWKLFAERQYPGVVLFGEVCGPGIQKGVRYLPHDSAPSEVIFRAFDVMIGDNLVTHDLFAEICDAADVPRAPIVWRGEPTLQALDALLEQPSAEAMRNGVLGEELPTANLAEGVVIRSNPLLRNALGEWLIAKHKSAKFEEVQKAPRPPRPDASVAEEFAQSCVTQGRVLNVAGHLREAGVELQEAMSDMPRLIPAVIADLRKELGPEWRGLNEQGFPDAQIGGAVTKVLGRIYARMLQETAAE